MYVYVWLEKLISSGKAKLSVIFLPGCNTGTSQTYLHWKDKTCCYIESTVLQISIDFILHVLRSEL